jgi:hypothetical protein
MGTWFWLNIPLMLLFLGCWAGIPLWHTLSRWSAELDAKHAEVATKAAAVPVMAVPAQAAAAMREAPGPAYAPAAGGSGR